MIVCVSQFSLNPNQLSREVSGLFLIFLVRHGQDVNELFLTLLQPVPLPGTDTLLENFLLLLSIDHHIPQDIL